MWLDRRNIAYTTRDIFRHPLSDAELRALAERAGGATAIFSWKSPSARPLGLSPDSADPEHLPRLMAAEPRLVKRPIVAAGERIAVGSDPAGLARLLGEA